MKTFFEELFEYGHHSNKKLAEKFIENSDKTSAKSIELFSHILNAHQIWNCRVAKDEAPFGVWQVHAPGSFESIDVKNYQKSLHIIDEFEFTHLVRYRETMKNSLRDILFHVVNHSTYHRGQIATEFKKAGIEPLISDYIAYRR